MWNTTSGGQPGYSEPTWSPEQLTRLEREWRQLQRSFAYHPHVTVAPLRGDPPTEYQIDFRVTTLVIDEAGQLQYASEASVNVLLPPGFPIAPPVIRPLSGLYHPNVSWEGFYLESAWHANETLAGLARRIGDLLAYRIFDPNTVVNPSALEWLNANPDGLPVDAQANFSPGAGGDPLGRICNYGAQTIESIRQSLGAAQSSMLGREAPDDAGVAEFSLRTRWALNLFLDRDVPEELRAAASDLDNCAQELPATTAAHAWVRGQKARADALRQSARQAAESRAPLAAELDRLAAVVQSPDPDEPVLALHLIPEAPVLQPFQLKLPKLLGEADRRLSAVRAGIQALGAPPPDHIPSDSTVGQRLTTEWRAAKSAADAARKEADACLAAVDPVAKRAREDLAALDQVVRYREYVDMVTRGRAVERRVAEWGSAGVQAYFIENESGEFGPFQFEQPVNLGTNVFARNAARGAIEVRDTAKDWVLGQGPSGEVKIDLPSGGAGGEKFATTFRLTERCDDLLVQLDFLRRQCHESIEKFNADAGASASWCGRFCRLLATPGAREKLTKELAKVSNRWKLTMLDLGALSPLKERLATFFLLSRVAELAPALMKALTKARTGMAASDKRLEEIVKRSGRDVETDRLVVPPKYAKAYEDELDFREKSADRLKNGGALVKSLATQLSGRLRDPKQLGRAGTPAFRILPPLPADVEALPIGDHEIAEQIAMLEDLLKVHLGGPRPAAPPPEAPAESELPQPMPEAVDAVRPGDEASQEGEFAAPPEELAAAEYAAEDNATVDEGEQVGETEHAEVGEQADADAGPFLEPAESNEAHAAEASQGDGHEGFVAYDSEAEPAGENDMIAFDPDPSRGGEHHG